MGLLRIGFLVFTVLLITQTVYAEKFYNPPFKVKARAAVLMNSVSGQIIFEQDSEEKIPPASLTKLMTLYLAHEAVDNGFVALSDQVRISKKAWRTGGSKMFLEVGKDVPLETILQGIAVVSGNDACVAVSEFISGVEEVFVEKMNKQASVFGMTKTVFKDSSGLNDHGQYTTASDMAILAHNYIKYHPEALKAHSIKKMTFNNITQPNRNGLLWLDYGVDGLKTGSLDSAGFHIIATAYREGDRYIAVVMGAKGPTQRENIALKLLNYGFRNFQTSQVLTTEEPLVKVSLWKGTKGEVPLGVLESTFITIPNDNPGDIYIEKDFPARFFAPVSKNQEIGQLRVIVNGKQLKTLPLASLESIERAGFIKRIVHGMILFFILPPYWGTTMVLLAFMILVLAMLISLKKNKKKKEGFSDINRLMH